VVEAAFEADADGDFGRLVLLAAATGARFSQLAALTILDFQINNARLMMPSSRKGKNRQPGARAAVPASLDVMDRIMPAIAGRAYHEPLLLRWAYRATGGPATGQKTSGKHGAGHLKSETYGRKRWASQASRPIRSCTPCATVSIVRGLVKNLPVRLVAALHDTSVEMIEKHYAAFIIDVTEDLARQTLLAFEEPKRLQAAE